MHSSSVHVVLALLCSVARVLKSRSAVYTITTIFYILPSIYIVIVYVVHSCSMSINDAETQAKNNFYIYYIGNGRLYSSSRVQTGLQGSYMPVRALQLIWWKLTTVIIVITIMKQL